MNPSSRSAWRLEPAPEASTATRESTGRDARERPARVSTVRPRVEEHRLQLPLKTTTNSWYLGMDAPDGSAVSDAIRSCLDDRRRAPPDRRGVRAGITRSAPVRL